MEWGGLIREQGEQSIIFARVRVFVPLDHASTLT